MNIGFFSAVPFIKTISPAAIISQYSGISPYCQRRNIKRQLITGTEISNDSESSIAFNYGNFTLLNIIKQDLSCNRILFFNDLHHRVRYILLSQNRKFFCVFFCRLFFWQIFGTDTASQNQHLQN